MNRNIFSSNNDGWGAIHVRILILKFVLYKRLNIKIIAWYSYQFYYISNGTWSKMTQNSQVNNPFLVSGLFGLLLPEVAEKHWEKRKGVGMKVITRVLSLHFCTLFWKYFILIYKSWTFFYLDAWHSINFAWKIYM